MFKWTEDVISFREDAHYVNQTERDIANRLYPYLQDCHTVCDAGCGLGFLSLELAQHGFIVTASDLSHEAISYVKAKAKEQGVALTIREENLFAAQVTEPYDAMVFSFFGEPKETLEAIRNQCKGKALIIKKNWENHRFDIKNRPLGHTTFTTYCQALDQMGIHYLTETFSVEMGQPFRSLEDAVHFFTIYNPDGEAPGKEEVASKLQTREGEFPWMYPSQGNLGLIIIDSKDVLEER